MFRLDEEILSELADAVARGAAPSKDELVQRALVRELNELRRQTRRRLWEEAARDPLFLKDSEDVEEAFRSADAESIVMAHQVRTISKERLGTQLGSLDDVSPRRDVREALREHLDLE